MQKKELLYLILVLLALLLVHSFLIISGEGAYGGADNIGHYRIARYAFKYHHLFFDHWGKPVFTLLFAPFAQLGFKATQLLNVIIGLAAMAVAAYIAIRQHVRYRLVLVAFIAFSPIYFLMMESCLTEVLMSLFLVLGILMFQKKRYYLAAILLSFLPFVRTESIVVFPLFAAAFLWHRKYLTLPLLLTGTVFYSLAGWFVYKDFLWVIHQMPYSIGSSIYGSGELLHFVKSSTLIFGIPFTLFLIIGTAVWGLRLLKRLNFNDDDFWLFILVTGSWTAYFAAHSFVWWKGMGGSLGLIRVIAGVIPLAAITALAGVEWLIEKIRIPFAQTVALLVLLAFQAASPFSRHKLPFMWEQPQQLMASAADFIRKQPQAKIFYFDPFLLHFLDMDPYDQQLNNWGIWDKAQPSNSLEWGQLLVWDAHFGPNEGGVQLASLMDDPYLQLEKAILPVENFKVLGGYDYGIYVFRKVQEKKTIEPSDAVEKELVVAELSGAIEFDGKLCLQMDNTSEYSQSVQLPVAEIISSGYIELLARVTYLPQEPLFVDGVLLVLSIESDGKSVSYNKADLETSAGLTGWRTVELPLRTSAALPPDAVIKLYIWNKDRRKLLVGSLWLSAKGF